MQCALRAHLINDKEATFHSWSPHCCTRTTRRGSSLIQSPIRGNSGLARYISVLSDGPGGLHEWVKRGSMELNASCRS
jgi:hypothetical protein